MLLLCGAAKPGPTQARAQTPKKKKELSLSSSPHRRPLCRGLLRSGCARPWRRRTSSMRRRPAASLRVRLGTLQARCSQNHAREAMLQPAACSLMLLPVSDEPRQPTPGQAAARVPDRSQIASMLLANRSTSGPGARACYAGTPCRCYWGSGRWLARCDAACATPRAINKEDRKLLVHRA